MVEDYLLRGLNTNVKCWVTVTSNLGEEAGVKTRYTEVVLLQYEENIQNLGIAL